MTVSRPVGGVLFTGPFRDTGSVAIHLCGPPGDVCRAAPVTRGAGALLPHRFTLTCARRPSAVCFLWHFPAGRPDWPLASTLPCGAPTFLDTIAVVPRPPGRLTVAAIVART